MSGENQTREQRLYNNLVDAMNEIVKPDEKGNPPKVDAASLNAIRAFLKDHNISADEDQHQGLKQLGDNARKQLPFARPPSGADA